MNVFKYIIESLRYLAPKQAYGVPNHLIAVDVAKNDSLGRVKITGKGNHDWKHQS